MRSRLPDACWVGLVLLLTSLFYWKLVFSNRFTFINSLDIAGQVLPWYQVQAKAWNDGAFPLWDPYVVGPAAAGADAARRRLSAELASVLRAFGW